MDKVLFINQQSNYHDSTRGTQTEDSGLGREERQEAREPDSQGMDTSSKGDIRPNGVGSGSVSGSSHRTKPR